MAKKKCKDVICSPHPDGRPRECNPKTGRCKLVDTKNKCPQDKIYNPETGRCVKKSGKIGQRLLQGTMQGTMQGTVKDTVPSTLPFTEKDGRRIHADVSLCADQRVVLARVSNYLVDYLRSEYKKKVNAAFSDNDFFEYLHAQKVIPTEMRHFTDTDIERLWSHLAPGESRRIVLMSSDTLDRMMHTKERMDVTNVVKGSIGVFTFTKPKQLNGSVKFTDPSIVLYEPHALEKNDYTNVSRRSILMMTTPRGQEVMLSLESPHPDLLPYKNTDEVFFAFVC